MIIQLSVKSHIREICKNVKQWHSSYYNVFNGQYTESNRTIDKFYQTFKEAVTPILDNLFQRIIAEEILSNSFCEIKINLYQNQTNILHEKQAIDQYLS